MDWLPGIIASRRGSDIVISIVEIENGKLWFTTILNIGIGIIVPASVETTDLTLNLKDSSNISARVLEAG
jgi:hypothetical protein